MKICNLCKETKPYEDFPRHSSYKDGYYSRCKKCNYALEKEWRKNNQGKKREIRTRYRGKNKEKIRYADKLFYAKNKERICEYQKQYKKSNPLVKSAYQEYEKALRNGVLQRPDICQICDQSGKKIDGHHHDYEKPLEVIWICKSCHAYIHAKINRADRLSEKTPKGDAIVESCEETARGEVEVPPPPSEDGL